MNFEKKLVILTGKVGRGTVLLERNGMGTFVTVNTFSLPDLTAGEYALGVKTATQVFRREIGSLGRIKSRFALPDGEYDSVHLVLFRTYDEEVVLYGTSAARKLWEGNLMDGIRRGGVEKKIADTGKALAEAQEFKFSEKKIEDYFLDIEPSAEYYDGALAEVNYFDYSPRVPLSQTAQNADYYDKPVTPSEMQRRYLSARFGGARAFSAEVKKEPATVMPFAAIRSNENVGGAAESAAFTTVSALAEQPAFEKEADVKREKSEKKDGGEIKIKRASEYTVEQAIAAVKTDAGFYATVKEQLDELFSNGERFSPLEEALPGTRWVKVDYDGSGRYYTVGLIGAAPDYIAYGVPGRYGDAPPALEGADFVPLKAELPAGDGFWVLFQSAETGKEIPRNP